MQIKGGWEARMDYVSSLTLRMPAPSGFKVAVTTVPQLAPYFQGALMERIDDEYAEALHRLPFNPYSQYCQYDHDENQIVWRISALGNEAAERIIEPVLKCDTLFIKRLDAVLPIESKTVNEVSVKSLTDLVVNDTTRKSSIEFMTPTAFKSKGRYVFMPSVGLIFQNLLMHYGQVFGGDKEVDPETIEYIDENAMISAYSLRSRYFENAMQGGRKIPAFIGSVTISAKGPQQLVGLLRMLLKFGEYSGIGIKTSMGMGGVLCK